MDMEVKNRNLEKIFSVIKDSYSIDKHVDFFNWLQNSVNEILPHNLLLTSWGDYDSVNGYNSLSYDVASSMHGVNTKLVLNSSDEVGSLMQNLHKRWLQNSRKWFAINHLRSGNATELPCDFINGLKESHSLLVYGVSDVRGSNECLYVFFSAAKEFDVGDSVMGLIMPHIDNALRKIQHIEPIEMHAELAHEARVFSDLSHRELEIIHWVKSGKTNFEISMILEISQNTVKSHLKRIFHKLNVTRRAQAVAILSN